MSYLQKARRYLGPVTLLFGTLFFVYYVVSNFALGQLLQASYLPAFVAAFLFTLIVFPTHAVRWWLLYRFKGVSIRFIRLLRTFMYYQMSSFVPGVIPQLANLDHYGQKEGLERKDLFSVLGVESAINVIGAFILLLLFLGQYPDLLFMDTRIFLLGLPGLLILLHPTVMETPLRITTSLLGKDPITIDLRYRDTLIVLCFSIVSWILSGTGFYLLVLGLGYELSWFAAVAIYAGSWAIGFVVLILPGGIGVREGSMVYLLQYTLPVEVAILIAGVARVWSTTPQVALFLPFAARDVLSIIHSRLAERNL